MKKTIISFMAGATILGSIVTTAFAQAPATTSPAVAAYINELQILRQLRQGMSGEDVKALQLILSTDPDVYPEGLVTGYYGALTSKAVAKLQKKHGLQTVGNVGPLTLKKINELTKNKVATTTQNGVEVPCVSVPPGHLIAPGQLKKRNGQPLAISPCQKLPPGIMNKIGGTGTSTKATTTPPTGTTTPPVVYPTPVFSALMATSTASTTAQISWNSDQYTTTRFWYGTSSPVVFASTTLIVSNNAYTLPHLVTLTNLNGSTTYYYMFSGTSLFGVTATSSQYSFTTLGQ